MNGELFLFACTCNNDKHAYGSLGDCYKFTQNPSTLNKIDGTPLPQWYISRRPRQIPPPPENHTFDGHRVYINQYEWYTKYGKICMSGHVFYQVRTYIFDYSSTVQVFFVCSCAKQDDSHPGVDERTQFYQEIGSQILKILSVNEPPNFIKLYTTWKSTDILPEYRRQGQPPPTFEVTEENLENPHVGLLLDAIGVFEVVNRLIMEEKHESNKRVRVLYTSREYPLQDMSNLNELLVGGCFVRKIITQVKLPNSFHYIDSKDEKLKPWLEIR